MERTKTISWDDPGKNKRSVINSISGLEYLSGIKEGQISPPPAANLVGYRLCDVDKGYAAFELNPGEYHYNPFATVHGGILSTLLDSTMAASVISTLPAGFSCSTIELKVNFIRPVTVETGVLKCEARPVHTGKKLATAEGKARDENGILHAHGVCTCSIFRVA